MKRFLIVVMAMTALGAFAVSPRRVPAQSPVTSGATKKEPPFACDLSALTPEVRKRHFNELGPALRSLKTGVRELADGYEFQFPSDPKTFQLVAEWAIQERSCCPFFDINLRLEREGGPLWLRLTGREGVKEFIRVEGASWIKP